MLRQEDSAKESTAPRQQHVLINRVVLPPPDAQSPGLDNRIEFLVPFATDRPEMGGCKSASKIYERQNLPAVGALHYPEQFLVVVEIPLAAVQIWRKQGHPIYLKLLENQLIHKEHKERFMLLYSPEQRYLLFCQQFPDLLPRLTDQHIAAYLGITPISLSRIKARLKKSS